MKKNIALILAAALVLPTVIAAGGCGANSGFPTVQRQRQRIRWY